MIVTCTSCQTRYRFDDPGTDGPEFGRCTRCEAVVNLAVARRAYVLMPSGSLAGESVAPAPVASSPAPDPISDFTPSMPSPEGLDLPPETTDASAAMPPETPPTTDEEFEAFPPPPSVETPFTDLPEAAEASEVDLPETPFALPSAVDGGSEASAAAAEEPVLAAAPAPAASGRSRAYGPLIAVLLAVAGAAAGYHAERMGWINPVTVHQAVQPIAPALVGGLVGLLMGWFGYRWTARQR